MKKKVYEKKMNTIDLSKLKISNAPFYDESSKWKCPNETKFIGMAKPRKLFFLTNEIDLNDGTILTEAIRIVKAFAINGVKYSPHSMFVTSLDTLKKIAERKKITIEREIKINLKKVRTP